MVKEIKKVYHSNNVTLSYIKVDEIIFRDYTLQADDESDKSRRRM